MERAASANCPTCDTILEYVPVARDECGAYAVIEARPCAGPACEHLLCSACGQFHCDGCGQIFCIDHLVSVSDGTDRPLRLCTECDAESKPLCPACGEHADMRPMENSSERWYECACCDARMDEAEIDAAQPPEPAPTCMQCYELMMSAATVGDMCDLIKAHRAAGCPHCGPKLPDRRPVQTSTPKATAQAA